MNDSQKDLVGKILQAASEIQKSGASLGSMFFDDKDHKRIKTIKKILSNINDRHKNTI